MPGNVRKKLKQSQGKKPKKHGGTDPFQRRWGPAGVPLWSSETGLGTKADDKGKNLDSMEGTKGSAGITSTRQERQRRGGGQSLLFWGPSGGACWVATRAP